LCKFPPEHKEKHPKSYDFGCDLVAGMGFERPFRKYSRLASPWYTRLAMLLIFVNRFVKMPHRGVFARSPMTSSVGHEREQFSSHRRDKRNSHLTVTVSFVWDEGPKKMQRTPSRRPPVGGRVGGQVLKKVKILIENSHFGTARKFRFCLTFLSHLYFFSHQNLYLMICFTADSFFQNKDVFPKNQFKLNLLLARFFY